MGIHTNQFGAGSSRPVIRGQDGARVKVLQMPLKILMFQLYRPTMRSRLIHF